MESNDPKKLRIVFMGTPEFATASLKKLFEDGFNIVGVVTVPDRKAGRGQKITFSDVKKYALENKIPILQPEKLKDQSFLSELEALKPELSIVVAFRMLPEEVWAMPKYGTINLHASLLPNYRGAAPINHAIINGEKETGVTTFFIDHKIDTGNIILQEKTQIEENEIAGELHDKLMQIGSELLKKTVVEIATEKAKGIPQISLANSSTKLSEAPKIFKDDCKVDWTLPIDQIHNKIRGLSPYPGAFTELISPEGETYTLKIFKSKKNKGNPEGEPFKIRINSNEHIIICLSDGYIQLLEIQLSGKRRMPASEFLRGFPIDKGWSVKPN